MIRGRRGDDICKCGDPNRYINTHTHYVTPLWCSSRLKCRARAATSAQRSRAARAHIFLSFYFYFFFRRVKWSIFIDDSWYRLVPGEEKRNHGTFLSVNTPPTWSRLLNTAAAAAAIDFLTNFRGGTILHTTLLAHHCTVKCGCCSFWGALLLEITFLTPLLHTDIHNSNLPAAKKKRFYRKLFILVEFGSNNFQTLWFS